MEFSITAQNGDSVKVEAENWMVAMGKAMTFFGVEIADVGRLVCSPGKDGSVFVDNPGSERTWMLRPIAGGITVVAAASSVAEELPEEPVVDKDPVSTEPPPTLSMPETSSLKKELEDIETLAERLFDLSMDLAEATPDRACQLALDLVLEFVDIEAASVARGNLNDPVLRFVAATGPTAEQLLGTSVQFGEGLIGMCFDMGGTMIVDDISEENRHAHHVDEAVGFDTKVALLVPIADEDGQTYGVIELLNPGEGSFSSAHVEAVETVARTLAGALSASII